MNEKLEIKIASQKEAEQIHSSYDYIISILRSTQVDDLFVGDNVLTLRFDDIRSPMPGFIVFGEYHLAQLVNFVAKIMTNPGKILVHCHAGVSRSAAIAIVTMNLILGSGKEKQIFEYLKNIRPQMRPNIRILNTADKLLGLEGKLVNSVK